MLRDLGKTFRLRQSCGRSAGLPAVLALIALSAFTRAAEVPVLALPPADAASAKPENRSLVAAVESSTAAGMPSLTESLGEDAIAKLPASSAATRRVRIALATSRIQRSAYADAEKVLRKIGNAADKSLRLGLVAYGLGKVPEARTHLTAARKGYLSDGGTWRDILEGLVASETRRNDDDTAAEQFFNSAADKAANNPLVLAQVSLLRRRMQMRIQQKNTDALDELGKLIELPDARQTFQFAKIRAFAQYRAGNAMGAIAIMNAAPAPDADLSAERNLLIGLMYGLGAPGNEGRHADGRAALLRVVEAKEFPGSVEVKSAALAALCDAVVTAPSGETVIHANAIYGALTAILSRQNSPLSKASGNSVADLIYYTRARIMLTAAKAAGSIDAGGAREKADDALRDLLEKFPDSKLRADALALTADLAKQSGAFRKAADALDKLKDIVSADEKDALRLDAADCYFRYGDWANAAAGYAIARKNLRDETARGDALIGEIRSLIADGRIAPDPSTPNDPRGNATKSLLEASASGARIPADARLRATWLLADALRKSGEYTAAGIRVGAALAASPDAGMRVRFLWLRAMIELATDKNREAAATSAEIARLVQNPAPDTPEEIRDNAPAILAQTALLKARALLGAGGVAGAESGFRELREKFPKAPSAAASYLVEGRYLSNKGLHAQALDVFKSGYDRFADEKSPELFDYAVASLFGAANEAVTLADRKGPEKLKVSFDLLKELTKRLEELPPEKLEKSVFFRARLMQGDILRRIGEFDSALKVYEDLVTQYPNNGDRLIAELARADCLTVLGASQPKLYARAAAEYERLVNLPGRAADLAAEAAFKRANVVQTAAEATLGSALNAKVGDPATAERIAQLNRDEAAKTLWQTINDLLHNPAEASALNPTGREWISRGLFLVSELHERNKRTVDARNAIKLLLDYNAGLKDGTHRLPFVDVARERLKKLSGQTATTLP